MMRRLLLLSVLLIALPLPAEQKGAGEVAFANSGAPAAQPSFLQGLALLHDFEYQSAAIEFRKAQEIDPAFVMAYWGEALTYTHPIWFQQDLAAARTVLQRLGATPEARSMKATTARERDYLVAVEVLYGKGSKEERDIRYADTMVRLHNRYPADVDATALAAVALLGTSHQGRDFAIYMRAAAMLEEVFPAHQNHPGVLHYLIHSYDDPIHAPLGMRAARLYGGVAPEAGHALHMTSHIFIAMGKWDEVIAANRQAIAVVNRQRAAHSGQPADCGHYPIWLHYAYLQTGRFDEASRALEACRASAIDVPFASAGAMDMREGRFVSLAEMRAHQMASGGPDVPTFSIPEGAAYANARFLMAYGDVLAAARDGEALRVAAGRLERLSGGAPVMHHDNMSNPSDRIREQVMIEEARALLLLSSGKRDEAIAALQKAAAAEQSMAFEFGPPGIPKPASELLGDVLLSAGRFGPAAKAYRDSLARTPGRTASVNGLQRAEKGVN